jgi:hypothetical protein
MNKLALAEHIEESQPLQTGRQKGWDQDLMVEEVHPCGKVGPIIDEHEKWLDRMEVRYVYIS